jgi:SNF2 family DNA or RNA helicase
MASKLTLHEYQKRYVRSIFEKKKVGLFLKPGRGKTALSLVAAKVLMSEGLVNSVLITAPKGVCHNVWHVEAAKWLGLNNLTFSLVLGTESNRTKALETEAQIYIVNIENLMWLSKRRHKFDMFIIDESSIIKNPSSKRFRACKNIDCKYMVELTGTPSPNGLLDIWTQLYLIDKGQRLGRTMTEYKKTYFNSDYMGYNFTVKEPEVIYNLIKDVTFSTSPEDDLELPERIDLTTYVTIERTKEYNQLKSQFVTNIDETQITTSNAATLAGKLLQFCNGAVYDEDKNIIEVHSAKLDALESIVINNPDETILVAYNFKSDLKRLKERFKDAYIFASSSDAVERWNRGEIKMLLCHPASAGKGLNLQAGGRTIVWFGLTWNLEDYLQFNARIHRQGQSQPVVINHIIAKGGIDELVMKALKRKEVSQKELLNSLAIYIKDFKEVA